MTAPKPGGQEVTVKGNGAVVAQGDGSGTNRADYDSWGWKEIKARITGTAAMGEKERQAYGEIKDSNPQTLWNAALTFRMMKEVLASTGKSIADQAKALAGEGGPWQGDGAKAFLSLMQPLSKAFVNHAVQIDGGMARLRPVPEQLWEAGNYLAWAIQTVNDIDNFYANEALRIAAIKGEDIVMESDKGNLVHVSKYPQVVALLDRDMRRVLKTLASQYEHQAYDTSLTAVPTPNPLNDKGGSDNLPPHTPPDILPYAPPPYQPTSVQLPEYKDPPELKTPPVSAPPDLKSAGYDPNAFASGSAIPGPFAPVMPPPGSASLTPPGASGLPPSGTGTNAPDLSAISPAAFGTTSANMPGASMPGSSGSGQYTPAEYSAGTGTGSGTGVPGSSTPPVPVPYGGYDPPPASARRGVGSSTPGSSGPGSSASSLPAPGEYAPVELASGGSVPGSSSVPNVSDWSAGNGSGSSAGTGNKDLGMPGMPFLPAAPGTGGSGAAAGSERPDSSGLLDSGVVPWSGSQVPGVGDPVVSGSDVSAASPEEWAVSQGNGASSAPGLPLMPGVPMAPGAGQGANASERSDSSGLLGEEKAVWEHETAVPALGEPFGVDVPSVAPETWSVTGVAEASPGVPLMPGVPMAPGQGANASERSDSSGLLGEEKSVWEHETVGGDPVALLPVVLPAPCEKRREEAGAGVFGLAEQAPVHAGTVGGAGGPSRPVATPAEEDRVPVVVPADGDEDFSAWDTAAAGAFFLVSPSRPAKGEKATEKPDHTVRETAAWGHSAGRDGAVHLQTQAEMAAARPIDLSAYLPRFDPYEHELNSSGLDVPEEVSEDRRDDANEDDEEQQERTSADLLRQDEGAWADRPKAAPGVIE